MPEQMDQTIPSVSVRIAWCRQRSRQARSEPEADAWQAEADGLRDAVMDRDHSDDYRLCSLEIRERYRLGLQDGIAMLHTSRIQRAKQADHGISQAAPRMELGTRSGGE